MTPEPHPRENPAPDRDGPSGESILPAVYEQLRALARERMAEERRDHTLQATALVHEAYLRLARGGDPRFANRAHFFAAAAEAMRRILVEHARARGREKRGGSAPRESLPLDVVDLAARSDPEEILMLDEALRRLESTDAMAAAVVRLRFFAGLSGDETAAALGASPSTVDRNWIYARAWLRRELRPPGGG